MSRFIIFISVITAIILLTDLYVFFGVRQLTQNLEPIWRKVWRLGYWVPTIITVVLFAVVIAGMPQFTATKSYGFFYFVIGFAFLFFIPKLVFLVFHFADDVTHLFRWIFFKFQTRSEANPEERINRVQFFNQLGLAASTVVFGSMLYGITKGKFAFRTLTETLSYPDLPKGFDGARIVHISDIHIGSFLENYEEVQAGVDMINALDADYVLFTGDLVNNFAEEAEPWINILGGIKAKYGKYSIFGNHDYSDYVEWASPGEKSKNLEQLADIHRRLGFKLLRNENTVIERNGDSIRLLGMENWGVGFQQYGNFPKTLEGSSSNEFRILLSHDPTHWEQQVMGKENIHLTLSGHTHGMQFGIEVPLLGIKISPSRLRYKRWGGLYGEEAQRLYVNRGFGFLGFPGRVGMPPEITLLELKRG